MDDLAGTGKEQRGLEDGHCKKSYVLYAIHWIDGAWKETKPDTITKCFVKASFIRDVAGKLHVIIILLNVHM